ncbi:MAG: DUF5615 family PIN-like protein [Candidatus Solibacter sp.]
MRDTATRPGGSRPKRRYLRSRCSPVAREAPGFSCRSCNSVVVTLNADFHAILAVQNAATPSVIRVRLQGLGGAAIAALVCQVLERYGGELRTECMIAVKPRKTTCHLLPRSD